MGPYYYRYYAASNSYIGTSESDGSVYYLSPDGKLLNVGTQTQWTPLPGVRSKACCLAPGRC